MIAAPAEGPTIMPSAWVTLVAHSTHSAVETWPHLTRVRARARGEG